MKKTARNLFLTALLVFSALFVRHTKEISDRRAVAAWAQGGRAESANITLRDLAERRSERNCP